MKNKKSEADPIKVIITAVILLVVLAVVLGIIYTIIVGKQIPFIGGKTDQITTDCDEDGAVGLSDDCPCDPDKEKLENGEKCGIASNIAVDNCPSLCKK